MNVIIFFTISIFALSSALKISAQDTIYTTRTWIIEREAPKSKYKTPDYPAHDIYTEGMYYSSGTKKGFERNPKKAFEKYIEAANQGHPLAQYQLGSCYYFGRGTDKDKKKAFKYWELSAQANVAEAQYHLGEMYYNGEEIKRNYNTAFELFSKSAEQGNPNAYYMIGVCYLEGHGVEKSKDNAITYLKKAEKKANRKARQKLKELLPDEYKDKK